MTASEIDSDGANGPAIVDAHHHFWTLGRGRYPWLEDKEPIPFRYGDYSRIRRPYGPQDYKRDTRRHRIVQTVHMEAEWERSDPVAETRWLESVASVEHLPSACIAHASLAAPDAEEVLAAQAVSPLVRGIRNKPSAVHSPDEARRGGPGSMDDPAWRRGYAGLSTHGLSFDLQTPWWHLDAAAELAADFPATLIILNHAGLPADRSPEALAGWRRGLEIAAAQPNMHIKLSGLGQPGQRWTVQANGPIIREAIRIFGTDRCMFASNYPVDSLVASFDDIVDCFLAAIAAWPEPDRRKLIHDNAIRTYRLKDRSREDEDDKAHQPATFQ